MLKWFRKYNKIILAVGCVVLMIAFLIPQAVSMFSPKPQDRVVGQMHGEDVTFGQLTDAAGQLELLQGLTRPFTAPLGLDLLARYDRETWLMVQRDAAAMGLSASGAEVNLMLTSLGIDDATLAEFARQRKVPVDYLRGVMRNWLVSERYRMLTQGRSATSGMQLSGSPPVTMIETLKQVANSVLNEPDPQMAQFRLMTMLQSPQVFEVLNGQGRVSASAAAYYIHENLERIEGRLLVITPEVTDEVRAAVSDEHLARLFEEYKSFPAGGGKPYPFGYRFPDRVKLEYLEVPMAAVRDAVQVGYIDVQEYYRDHRDDYLDPETGEAPKTPTDTARADITEQLRGQRAQALMQRILADARAAFAEDARGLTDEKGYKVLPDGFRPIPLEEVADRVAAKHGVQPIVVDLTGSWQTFDDLFAVEGLGTSSVEGSGMSALQYLSTVKELRPEGEAGQTRLQVGLAGLNGVGTDGTRYLPRLTAAERAHEPATLDEVRDQVSTDAAEMLAYERLLDQADEIRRRAAAEGLQALADEFGAVVETIEPMPKRERAPGGGAQVAPFLPQVGRDTGLVDQAFAVAAGLGPGADILVERNPAERTVSDPIDDEMRLAVLEVTSYAVPTQADFERQLAQGAGLVVDAELLGSLVTESPLSKEALAERVGFDLAAYEGDDEPADTDAGDTPADPAPAEAAS